MKALHFNVQYNVQYILIHNCSPEQSWTLSCMTLLIWTLYLYFISLMYFSSVEGSSRFRLRDISPSRLKEKRKDHERKKSDKGAKLSPSTKKNIVSNQIILFLKLNLMYCTAEIFFRQDLCTNFTCNQILHDFLQILHSKMCFLESKAWIDVFCVCQNLLQMPNFSAFPDAPH